MTESATPANAMGVSAQASPEGDKGAIAKFDPLMGFVKRKPPQPLRVITGDINRAMKKEAKR